MTREHLEEEIREQWEGHRSSWSSEEMSIDMAILTGELETPEGRGNNRLNIGGKSRQEDQYFFFFFYQ